MLTKTDRAVIDDALKQAGHKTTAKISLVVHRASASYHAPIMVFGLALGTTVASLLWGLRVLEIWPWLLCVQLGVLALCDLAYSLGGFLTGLIPRRIRHHLAAQAAMCAYHTLHERLSPGEPFALLFVSLAERYVHVVTNPVVHARIPGDWDKITDGFSQTIRADGLRAGCLVAVENLAAILAPAFPR